MKIAALFVCALLGLAAAKPYGIKGGSVGGGGGYRDNLGERIEALGQTSDGYGQHGVAKGGVQPIGYQQGVERDSGYGRGAVAGIKGTHGHGIQQAGYDAHQGGSVYRDQYPAVAGDYIRGSSVGSHGLQREELRGSYGLGQSLHGQSLHGQSLHGQSLHGQSLHGQSLQDQTLHGQSLHGQSLQGQSLHGQSLHGQSLQGQNLHGQSLHGQSLHGQREIELGYGSQGPYQSGTLQAGVKGHGRGSGTYGGQGYAERGY